MERLRRVSISVRGISPSDVKNVLELIDDIFIVESVKVRYRGREFQ